MKRTAALLFALLVFLPVTATWAQKVTIDYAHDFDFSGVKTFTYVDTPDSNARNELDDARIRNAIIRQLEERGLEQVESGGDIMVTYHVTTTENTTFDTTYYGYGGWGPGWGHWGGPAMATSSTTSYTYIDGTLIVDAYEPAEKKLVWHGSSTVTVKDNPEKRSKQVDKILDKMGKKWQKILASKDKK